MESTTIETYKGHEIRENERYDEDAYRELLNDVYGEVSICGYNYSASDALEAVDPVAFRCGFADSQEYFYTFDADPDSVEYESLDDCRDAIDSLT
jgi:hypothetical protein